MSHPALVVAVARTVDSLSFGRPQHHVEVSGAMKVVYSHCCGLDVHKRTVVACLLTAESKEVRTFGTTTTAIREMADWLVQAGCTHIAMESTGVYWRPLYNLLEETPLEIWVVNARHIKAVPGRKTDVRDAEWLADLLRHGLVRPSLIPDRRQRELQDLIRYRRTLIAERADEANRIQKVLEGANIKLASVISNILGVSGRAMIQAMIEGETDAHRLAEQAQTHLKATADHLEDALSGQVGAHQRFLLATQLRHVDYLTDEIARLDGEIEERMRPFADEIARLDTIPGIGVQRAQEIIAAIGVDMSRFPSAGHLASWAKLCPGTKESAGKHAPTGIGKGNPYLRVTLTEAAWAATRTKTYLAAQYRRLAARRGGKRAIIAVAHSILVIVYHILKDGTVYKDLGQNYFDERDKEAVIRREVRRLEKLGCKVTVERAA
jgi:transposase